MPPPHSIGLHRRLFGLLRTHATGGLASSALTVFEACQTRYVLQVDTNIMVARRRRDHDLDDTVRPLLSEPWVLDCGTMAKFVRGHHEGAVVSYYPNKPGRPAERLAANRSEVRADGRGSDAPLAIRLGLLACRGWNPNRIRVVSSASYACESS